MNVFSCDRMSSYWAGADKLATYTHDRGIKLEGILK